MNFNRVLIKHEIKILLTRNTNNIGMINKRLISSMNASSSYRNLITTCCTINTFNSQNNNNFLPVITKRLLYSSKIVNTINKWYTTTELKTEMNETEMYAIISNMTEEQRNSFTKALTLWESQRVKGEFEGQLAANRWRSRFGRPTKLTPALGAVDPSGSYCAVPEDWLQKKFVETTPAPSKKILMKLGLANALPFIGFGFLDNFTMIIAGDYIESSLGVYMCISTMAAAALGNTISDILGIGSAYYVERLAESIGVKTPKLTPIQLEMSSTRRYANFGRVIGITIGCIVGMVPLLFMNEPNKKEKERRAAVAAAAAAAAASSGGENDGTAIDDKDIVLAK